MSSVLPLTEVLVVADCWQREPDSEAVIQRAVAAAAENVDEDVAEAEVAVMLTDDVGIRTGLAEHTVRQPIPPAVRTDG